MQENNFPSAIRFPVVSAEEMRFSIVIRSWRTIVRPERECDVGVYKAFSLCRTTALLTQSGNLLF